MTLSQTSLPKPDQIYKHYKGGQYRIIALAEDVATGSHSVVYHSISSDTLTKVWMRSLDSFLGQAEHNGRCCDRFELVE